MPANSVMGRRILRIIGPYQGSITLHSFPQLAIEKEISETTGSRSTYTATIQQYTSIRREMREPVPKVGRSPNSCVDSGIDLPSVLVPPPEPPWV